MYNAVRNIGESWNEVKQANMNIVWRMLCPEFVNYFRGFEKTVDKVTKSLVEMGKPLELEIESDDVNTSCCPPIQKSSPMTTSCNWRNKMLQMKRLQRRWLSLYHPKD